MDGSYKNICNQTWLLKTIFMKYKGETACISSDLSQIMLKQEPRALGTD